MPDCIVIGGGVIGLSLAWELNCRGHAALLLERGKIGRGASWAGAGILPPACWEAARHPMEQLRAWSNELHPLWASRLRGLTGIDNGFRRCGGLYLARNAGEVSTLMAWAADQVEDGIEIEPWTLQQAAERFPALKPLKESPQPCAVYWLPGENQLRNPHHLKALEAACRIGGVEIRPDCEVTGFLLDDKHVSALQTSQGMVSAEAVFIAGGAWSTRLLVELGIRLELAPIRGQMLLYRCERPPLTCIVNEGPRYLVPREDGRLLVGSTEEDVGFDPCTTPEALADLRQFACELVPLLRTTPIEASWAGLRPGTHDGYPYLGRATGLDNVYVATGHFRSGLQLSPATASLLADLHDGIPPKVDLSPFALNRG